jgi:hypothetical protein
LRCLKRSTSESAPSELPRSRMGSRPQHPS